jgi:hypothetical protein
MTDEHAADRALLVKALEALREFSVYWEEVYARAEKLGAVSAAVVANGHAALANSVLSSPAAREALREHQKTNGPS